MTVAAIILAANPESALADADGIAAVRRIADVAWAGGATPIVVVAHDPVGSVAAALTGSPVTLAQPAPLESGPAGQMVRGIELAVDLVHETSGALIWPARMAWVGPETVTSMIETHGPRAGELLTPSYDGRAGWPVLLPLAAVDRLRSVAPDRMPDQIIEDLHVGGLQDGPLELGDPGTIMDVRTPRSELPPYIGPVEPAAGHTHEWGAQVADDSDEGPLEGPALAPYAPAGASDVEG